MWLKCEYNNQYEPDSLKSKVYNNDNSASQKLYNID